MWFNQGGSTHTVTVDDSGGFDSGHIAKESVYSHTFNAVGTFAYHCTIHSTMHGTITVNP